MYLGAAPLVGETSVVHEYQGFTENSIHFQTENNFERRI